MIIEGVLYNCSARIEYGEPKGNVTEQGLIKFLLDLGVRAEEIIRQKDDNILEIIPFNSGRKRATTAIRHPDN